MIGLIPGVTPPTENLNTNLAVSSVVFLYYNYHGIRAHGAFHYFKHFLGPVLWLAPLFVIIEIIGHIARPISLSLRLLGNMFADHKVVSTFFGIVPLLVPVPFLILGVLVVIVQTLVFCLLTMVYIQASLAHEHDEHELEHADVAHSH